MTGAAADSTSADNDVVFPSPTPVAQPSLSPRATPSFRSAASDQLDQSSSPPYDALKPRSGASRSDHGSGSGSKETPEQLIARLRTTGTCGYYPNKFKECAEPRSCFDCLNFVVNTEEGGCMVSEYGRCVPTRQHYVRARDYRSAKPANADTECARNASASAARSFAASQSSSDSDDDVRVSVSVPVETSWYYFPATSVQYCDRADPQCTECRRTVFADYIDGLSKSGGNRFCYGERGCVCVATCEARRDNPPPPKDCIVKALAASKNDRKDDDGDGGAGLSSVFMILGAMAFVVVTVFAIYRIRSTSERRLQRANGNSSNDDKSETTQGGIDTVMTPDASSSPGSTAVVTVTSTATGSSSETLALFGWQAMREEKEKDDDVVSKEHMPLADVESASPLKPSSVQLFSVVPSAPDIDKGTAMAIPVPMAVLASAPVMFSLRAMASAPDFEDMDDENGAVL